MLNYNYIFFTLVKDLQCVQSHVPQSASPYTCLNLMTLPGHKVARSHDKSQDPNSPWPLHWSRGRPRGLQWEGVTRIDKMILLETATQHWFIENVYLKPCHLFNRNALFPWARNFTVIAKYWLVPGTDSSVIYISK